MTVIFVIANCCTLPPANLATSRLVWSIARDGGLPFSSFFARVDPYSKVPRNAQILVWFLTLCLGALYVGSTTAFNAIIGSTLIANNLAWGVSRPSPRSCACSDLYRDPSDHNLCDDPKIPILANVLGRRRHMERGPFSLSNGVGYVSAACSCARTCRQSECSQFR